MIDLINVLNNVGFDAYLISFSDINNQNSTNVWEDDMHKGYTLARSIADQHALPLFFLGYSLGALVGQNLICCRGKNIEFNKQVLLAPAVAIKLPQLLKSGVSFLADNLRIPSYTPEDYRLSNSVPAKVYKMMFERERGILDTRFVHLNLPTLLIIDPKDELISYKKIKDYISKYKLTNYQCVVLESDLKLRNSKYHHLIINERTMGEKNWLEVVSRISEFLLPA
jgi:hypothetical protein